VGRRLALGRDRCPVLPYSRTTCETRRSRLVLGRSAMNYSPPSSTRSSTSTPAGWQMSFHCNGDVGFDVVLDVYERALRSTTSWGRTTWRSSTSAPVARSSSSGLPARCRGIDGSLPVPFWATYSTDALCPRDRLQWQAIGDAFAAGSRCLPQRWIGDAANVLLNIQGSVTRTTNSAPSRSEPERSLSTRRSAQ